MSDEAGRVVSPGVVVSDEAGRVVCLLYEAVVVLGEACILLPADAGAAQPVSLARVSLTLAPVEVCVHTAGTTNTTS